MNGIGLVFAGGGGKGAYEIGVWKYLHEIGLDRYVRCVSGTSVGALNAALFVGSTYECAENLWLNISSKQILTPRKIPDLIIDIGTKAVDATNLAVIGEKMLLSYSLGLPIVDSLIIGEGISGLSTIIGKEKIIQTLLNKIEEEYSLRIEKDCIFSRKEIIDMISEGLDVNNLGFKKLQNSEISCYATCFNCEERKVERFRLNDYSTKDIKKLLLASSAIPVIFPTEKFNGNNYCDGGVPVWGDNIPIEPVYDADVEYIIVVCLDENDVIDKSKCPNDKKIIEIIPKDGLGGLLKGTLNFSAKGAQRRLKLGYKDAKKHRELQEMIRVFER